MLQAARARGNAAITWRVRFVDGSLAALADRRRCGRPRRFTPVQVAEIKALACQLPAETGTPLSRWSCPELAREVVARRIADSISASTVRRWLRDDTLKPLQYRSWIFIRDPKFRPKAARIMDLYAGTFDGVPPSTCSGIGSSGNSGAVLRIRSRS
ncbi:helix-turn-helix domain-containing protein [Streptomyces sp. NPDC005134]|uniref:helix-turn-helix domain-containing protein n=1 Tax=Streptomyces sp. NPDC005098 TaxID=3154560 RepID=UPI0033B9ECD8